MTEQIACSTHRPTLRMLSDEQIRTIHNTSLDILIGHGYCHAARRRAEFAAGGRRLAVGRSHQDPRTPDHAGLAHRSVAHPHARPARPIGHAARRGQGLLRARLRLPVYVGSGDPRAASLGGRGRPALCPTLRWPRSDRLRHVDGHPERCAGHGSLRARLHPDDPGLYQAQCLYRQNRQDMEDIYTIACAVAGGEAELRAKPFMLLYAEPISPLLFNAGIGRQSVVLRGKGHPWRVPAVAQHRRRRADHRGGRARAWATPNVWSVWCSRNWCGLARHSFTA